MNTSDFAAKLAQKCDTTKVKAEEITKALFGPEGIIVTALVEGDEVKVAGFGTFATQERKGGTRQAFGETITTEDTTVVKFKVAKGLKERVAK